MDLVLQSLELVGSVGTTVADCGKVATTMCGSIYVVIITGFVPNKAFLSM